MKICLLNLVQNDGTHFRKVAGTNGGEWAGPCPSCGGTDRFRMWPEQGDGGRWWCRQCGKGGDAIQYLREFRSMSFQEACSHLGRDHGNRQPQAIREKARDAWTPRQPERPAEIWQTKAGAFVEWAQTQLWADTGKQARDWLQGRGLAEKTIRAFRLGWNPADLWRDRKAWGLPEAVNDQGKKKKLWLPLGLTIPKIISGVDRVRIRRPNPDQGPRYYLLPGSETGALAIPGGPVCVVVESELDAILLHQDAGELATMVALGNAQARPDRATTELLNRAGIVLVSLDSDQAGEKESWQWWLQHFPQAKPWPVILGKDPSEARQNGLDLCAWVMAGVHDDEDQGETQEVGSIQAQDP